MLKKLYFRLPAIIQNYLNKAAAKVTNSPEEEFINSNIGSNYDLASYDKKRL